MSLWKIGAQRERQWEIVIEAETEGRACASCGKWGPNGEVHTFLFCELHKMGWDRKQIIDNVLFTADALRPTPSVKETRE